MLRWVILDVEEWIDHHQMSDRKRENKIDRREDRTAAVHVTDVQYHNHETMTWAVNPA